MNGAVVGERRCTGARGRQHRMVLKMGGYFAMGGDFLHGFLDACLVFRGASWGWLFWFLQLCIGMAYERLRSFGGRLLHWHVVAFFLPPTSIFLLIYPYHHLKLLHDISP